MENVFTEGSWDLRSIGRGETRSIPFKVKGFWSGDTIRVYTQRDYFNKDKSVWKFEISRSSGGRDDKEEPDEAVAAENYAHALLRASALVRELREHTPELIAYYKEYREECRLEMEAEKVAAQSKLDADPAVSVPIATAFVGVASAKARESGNGFFQEQINMRANAGVAIVTVTHGQNLSYKLNGNRISFKDLVAYLSTKCSAADVNFNM